MPDYKKGEGHNHYVSRCIAEVRREGTSQKAAVGKCEGMAKSHWTRAKSRHRELSKEFR